MQTDITLNEGDDTWVVIDANVVKVMLTIDERKLADPRTGAPSADGSSPFRRILVR